MQEASRSLGGTSNSNSLMTPNSRDLKDISPELLKYYVFVSTCIQEFRQFFNGQEMQAKSEKEIK